MRHALLTGSLALAVAACTTSRSPHVAEQPVEGGLLVRVVDSEGRAVAGAEVRAPRLG